MSRSARNKKSLIGKEKKENGDESRSLDDVLISFVRRSFRRFNLITLHGLHHSRISLLLLTVATLLVLVPFVGKAYHIDDPLFLWAAKQIQHNPADPYGFKVNWYGEEEAMWDVTKNPPLTSYYLALVSLIGGWGEIPVHLAMILPAVAAVLGTYRLALKLCPQPLEAALIGLLSPVFLVSGTTVMCDMMMLALWVWAVVLWIDGLDNNNKRSLLFSSILIALASLTKYYGMTLLPLLFAYSAARKGRIGWWACYFIVPLVILLAYQWTTEAIYGRGLLGDAAAYVKENKSDYRGIARGSIGLVFTGGCLIGTVFYAPFLWSRKYLVTGGALIITIAALVYNAGSIGAFHIRDAEGVRWSLILQFSVLFIAGISLLLVAALDLWKRRDAASLLLFLWVFGTFLFAAFINWSVNGRSIMPMVPAAGILLMRRIDAQGPLLPRKKWFHSGWVLVPVALIAVSVTWADYTLANAGREAALAIEKEYRQQTGKIWVQGHWGFQYYMESAGAEPVNPKRSLPSIGDIVAVPTNMTNLIPMNPQVFSLIKIIEIRKCRWLVSMQSLMGAGFYSDVFGPLPFVFGSVPPERYHVWVTTQEFKVK